MQEIRNADNSEIFTCVDKLHNPFLMSASFQNLIAFNGSFVKDGILHWQFSPKNKALELIEQLETKTEPQIHILDFANATNKFWKTIEVIRKIEGGETKK